MADDTETAFGLGLQMGVRLGLSAYDSPRVRRPEGISDETWINHWGAVRQRDGSIHAPMSTAHLFPGAKRGPKRVARKSGLTPNDASEQVAA